MARVTITLVDEEKDGDTHEPGSPGTVNVRIESEPGFPGPAAPEDAVVTPAQNLGFALMEYLGEIINNLPTGPGPHHEPPTAEPWVVEGK